MIETERLLLREYTIDDFDALYEIMSDAETTLSPSISVQISEKKKRRRRRI